MNHKRDYLITVISVFLALGIGILIGASLSDNVIVKQQKEIVERMDERLGNLNENITALQEDKNRLNEELSAWVMFQEKFLTEYVGRPLEGFNIAVIYEVEDHKVIAPVINFLENTGIQVNGHAALNALFMTNLETVSLQGKSYQLGQENQRKDYFDKYSILMTDYLIGKSLEPQVFYTDEFLSVEIAQTGLPDKVLYFPGNLEKKCTELHNSIISSLKSNNVSFVSVYLSPEEANLSRNYEVIALENIENILGRLELLHMLESNLQEVINHD
ncbi:copper transporter [Candidatus Contubernalis alkaliaceticus]|uniref:copper transporter n=1 Tax=Candidatus Contubernalis alkaliaceticus TaxID=338645 RepID=UPI001F4C26DD|nr:copper transporter [Candidatus Contubernalis alkalaceticus]UNC92534.1 copper transporter [Candidatus Contubernalis alkalaceticus]